MNGRLILRRHEVTLFASGDRGRNQLLGLPRGLRFLRDLKRRGMTAPVVAVSDGAPGFWAARPARCGPRPGVTPFQ
jgi:hypothetical protein